MAGTDAADSADMDDSAPSLLERARRLGELAAERTPPARRRWVIGGYELSEGDGGLWWVRDMNDKYRSFTTKPAALEWIHGHRTDS